MKQVEEYLCVLNQYCSKLYSDSMQSVFAVNAVNIAEDLPMVTSSSLTPFYAEDDLREKHSQAKSMAYAQVRFIYIHEKGYNSVTSVK